ncbi:4Fe-4S single cluster domain-containing protein [Dactylosporangium sp. AC04546]|uniref:4Fe-4S single cluster domain-containing protein n=1 Tax=Dactylosporangium sp. AC04546 TaxID=2862460 RepID=UPI001EE06517|nr:4Fe-4S single cluster domain-containing protein [Dactylosporangium sp. AC04546]WVK78742.1 4Fe-4S single cluster domain-containing protein [Dactylosporangium sp. AC04546]
MELILHGVLRRSRANGPGERLVVWVQGCSLGCPGCFNPGTHASARGERREIAELVTTAVGDGVEGVTLTGGEPLEQPAAVEAFGAALRPTGLGLIILTGFTTAEIERDPARAAAVRHADLVVAGRYQRRRHLGAGLRGSANKQYWWRTGRYRAADLDALPDLEVLIAADGTVTTTGMVDA